MNMLLDKIHNMDWFLIIILCLTIGLAPFNPPHIYEKITMLLNGTLKRAIDWFDLMLHGLPWIILIIKTVLTIKR